MVIFGGVMKLFKLFLLSTSILLQIVPAHSGLDGSNEISIPDEKEEKTKTYTRIPLIEDSVLDKQPNETLVQNLIRQKIFYLQHYIKSDDHLKGKMSSLEETLAENKLMIGDSSKHIETFKLINSELDSIADQIFIHWPDLDSPFQEDFPAKVQSYLRNTKKLTTSTGYNLKFVLENPSDEKSIYAVIKPVSSKIQENIELCQKLNLTSYLGGFAENYACYERFVKLYPFRKAALNANLYVLNFCDEMADSHGACVLARLNNCSPQQIELFQKHFSLQSFKDSFWHLLIATLPDNVGRNMMVWVDQDSQFHVSHIDFEYSMTGFEAIKGLDRASYPVLLQMPFSLGIFNHIDDQLIKDWDNGSLQNFSKEKVKQIKEKSGSWLTQKKNYREIAIEMLGDETFTYAKDLWKNSWGREFLPLLKRYIGPIDYYFYRDISPVFLGSLTLWNETTNPLIVSAKYWAIKEEHEQNDTYETGTHTIEPNKGYMIRHMFPGTYSKAILGINNQEIILTPSDKGFDDSLSKINVVVMSTGRLSTSFSQSINQRTTKTIKFIEQETSNQTLIAELGRNLPAPLPEINLSFNTDIPLAPINKEISQGLYHAFLKLLDSTATKGNVDENTLATLKNIKKGSYQLSRQFSKVSKEYKLNNAVSSISNLKDFQHQSFKNFYAMESDELSHSLSILYHEIASIDESERRILLDGTYFPQYDNISYRDVEYIKSHAQNLFNTLNLCEPQISYAKDLIAVLTKKIYEIGFTTIQKIVKEK